MKKRFLQLTLVILTAAVFVSCNKDNNEDIEPQVEITGKWNITSAESNFESQGDNTNSTFDLAKDNLFIEFNSDGTYTSNAEFGIGELALNPNGTVSNTYTYNNGRLDLKLIESSLKKEVILYFHTSSGSNSLILNSDINDLLDAYNDQESSFDFLTSTIIEATIKTYAKLDFMVTLTK
ncbi:lipocalin family protein [Arcticibacterium luteifluviistationis]|uniref:Lipocalin-like domain-containing protein n=1 Tax=Arcticibacterium luteifluviistationis TaxID=1784714 RepID=A0A2Z4GGE2_9BACT|nr:lipocalin family protein [Arcticibacterium luteifluviistationis]AWW00252.1 hypothetical protein DJ013_19575 [Arcticibacterium luteifluviistationis]